MHYPYCWLHIIFLISKREWKFFREGNHWNNTFVKALAIEDVALKSDKSQYNPE